MKGLVDFMRETRRPVDRIAKSRDFVEFLLDRHRNVATGSE